VITYRRKTLPSPLRAVAWRQPADPATGRSRLVVVVDDSLSASEARDAAVLAVRKLPAHQSPRRPVRAASACVALLLAGALGAKVGMPLPDRPPPRGRRLAAVAVLETAPQYLSSAPAGALAG
jgi:hypothetical protein